MKPHLLHAAAFFALGLSGPARAEPDYATAIRADYARSLAPLWDWFHRNPDLSFKEVGTAARMAKELRAVPGLEVTEKVGGTGVVAVLRNGAGPTVLLRADMDALPLEEQSGLPNMSSVREVDVDNVEKPVMHACGHDTHMTGLVETARELAKLKDRWKGTVVFVSQPAEERTGGATAMLADGLYTRFPKPDYAIAWHVSAGMPTGKVSGSEAIQYSSSDTVNVTIPGIGAHAATPQRGRDPIYIGAQIVTALQGLVGREIDPMKPALITVGSFQAGTKANIIPDHADLLLTVRANDEETRQYLLKGIARVARDIALASGMPEDKLPVVSYPAGTSVTLNDSALARRLNAAFASVLGAENVLPFIQSGMTAEDFSYFIEPKYGVKGFYFAVGGTPQADIDAANHGGPPIPAHHSPLFKIAPEPAIVTGAIAMTAAVLDLLGPSPSSAGQ